MKSVTTPMKINLKRLLLEHQTTVSTHNFSLHSQPKEQFKQRAQNIDNKILRKDNEFITQRQPIKECQEKYYQLINEISTMIIKDSKLSIKETTIKNKYHLYLQENNRVIVSQHYQIPKKVRQIYHQESLKNNSNNINFVQGCLTKIGYYYYAIGNQLILYDCKSMMESNIKENTFKRYFQFQLNDPVLTIKEVIINSQLFSPKLIDKILIFSHPWKLSFYSYTIEDGRFKLHNLGVNFNPNCQRVLHIEYDSHGHLYYLDSQGALNIVILQKANTFSFFRRGKYSLKNNRIPFYSFEKVFKLNQTTWAGQLKYFFTNVYQYGVSLLPSDCNNLKIVCDRSRNIIFTLGDYRSNLINRTSSKIIYAYTIKNNNPHKIAKITQQQLISQYLSNLINIDKRKKCQIIQINSGYQNQSFNLQIIIKNGIKIYMYVGLNKFIFKQIIYPPDCRRFELQIQKYQEQQSKSNYITNQLYLNNNNIQIPSRQFNNFNILAYINNKQKSLTICKIQDRVFSYFISKIDQQNQKKTINQVKWKSKQKNNATYQNYLYKISDLALLTSYEKKLIKMESQNIKYIQIQSRNLHELARQVYMHPQHYVYATQQSIQMMIYLRPVDLAYNILSANINPEMSQQIFINYFENNLKYNWIEICSILIQIYSDSNGIYYQSKTFQEKLMKKLRIKNKTLNRYTIKEAKNNQQYQTIKISFKQINKSLFNIIETIIQVIISRQIGKQPKKKQNSKKIINFNGNKLLQMKLTPFMLYFCRVIRIIWNIPIDQIPYQQNKILVEKLLKLKQKSLAILQIGKDNRHIVSKIQQFSNFLDKCIELLYLCQNFQKLPSLIYQQSLLKSPQYFQEYLFYNICQSNNSNNILEQFSELFPTYITQNLKVIIRVNFEIKNQNNQENIITILNTSKYVPYYFIDYLRQIKKLKNIDKIKNIESKKSNNNQKIILPQLTNNIQKVKYAINQISSNNTNRRIKQYFISFAQRYIQELLNSNNQTDIIFAKLQRAQINMIIKRYKFQIMIIEQYKLQDSSKINVMDNIEKQLFDQDFLKKMVIELNSKQLLLIYYCLFDNQNKHQIDYYLNQLIQQYSQDWPKSIKQVLKKIIPKSGYELPLDSLIPVLIHKNQQKLKLSIILKLLKCLSKKNKINQEVWVSSFLYSIGYNRDKIIKTYQNLLLQKFNQENINQTYLIVWIQMWYFYKEYQTLNKFRFIDLSIKHLNRQNWTHSQAKSIIENMKILIDQLQNQ